MLNKLLKYDIKSTWRGFAGIYMAILLGVIIIPFILNNSVSETIIGISGFVAVAIVIATIVIMIVNLFRIYNTNVFSKEGYLTMTLPVTSLQVVSSKLIISSMWIILTAVVSVLGMFIFAFIINNVSIIDAIATAQKYLAQFSGITTSKVIMLVLVVVLSMVKEIAKLFLACSIAHIKQLNRFRIPLGILSYSVMTWAESFIDRGITSSTGLILNPASVEEFLSNFYGIMGYGMVCALIFMALYSAGTVWILNHKLNLD